MRTKAAWGPLVLGSLLAAHISAASADDHGLYADIDGGVASASSSFAWSVNVGYRFNSYFAMEAGYTDLGRETLQLSDPDDPTAQGRLKIGARGATFALLAHAPVGNWDPYFKLGVINSIADQRITAQLNDTEQVIFRGRDREPRIFGGVGLHYAVSEYTALSFGIDYFANVGEGISLADQNITYPHIGLAYRF